VTELFGLYRPVTRHTGIGRGSSSRKAMEKQKSWSNLFDQHEAVK
jgi:hypothetical protein